MRSPSPKTTEHLVIGFPFETIQVALFEIEPRLSAFSPDVRHGPQPGGVVQGARFDAKRRLFTILGVVDARSALRAVRTDFVCATVPVGCPQRWFCSDERDFVTMHPHRDAKGARGLFLAIHTMTRVNHQWWTQQLITNVAALTAPLLAIRHGA